jgi:hypothetical protein
VWLHDEDALMQHLNQAELLPLFRASAGVCLPHLRLALRRAPDAPAFERLQAAQFAIWQRFGAELDEFIRKRDHRFAAEPTGAEGSSWSRAVDLVSGQFGLGCGVGQSDRGHARRDTRRRSGSGRPQMISVWHAWPGAHLTRNRAEGR